MRASYQLASKPIDSGAATAIEMVISKREYNQTDPSVVVYLLGLLLPEKSIHVYVGASVRNWRVMHNGK